MINSFTYRGVWFLPSSTDQQVVGSLTFDPNSEPRLELTGTLVQRGSDTRELPFILGYTTDGKKVTLYNSFENLRSVSMPGIEVSEYTPMYVLVGAHFESEEYFKFRVIKGMFRNLAQWVGVSGFQDVFTNHETHETTIHYKLPDPIKFNLNSGARGQINFTSSGPYNRHLQT